MLDAYYVAKMRWRLWPAITARWDGLRVELWSGAGFGTRCG